MLLISSSILSSCQVLVNSFHLQSECCPNYIILIPSLSCFNRSVVSIIPLLTGLSSKCFQLWSSSLCTFFQFVQPLKVLWFHSFVKEET